MAESITLANAHYPFSLRPLSRDIPSSYRQNTFDFLFEQILNNKDIMSKIATITQPQYTCSLIQFSNPFNQHEVYSALVGNLIGPLIYSSDKMLEKIDLRSIEDFIKGEISPNTCIQGLISLLPEEIRAKVSEGDMKALEEFKENNQRLAEEDVKLCLQACRDILKLALEGDTKTIQMTERQLQSELHNKSTSLMPFVATVLAEIVGSDNASLPKNLIWELVHFLSKNNENFLTLEKVEADLEILNQKMRELERDKSKFSAKTYATLMEERSVKTTLKVNLQDVIKNVRESIDLDLSHILIDEENYWRASEIFGFSADTVSPESSDHSKKMRRAAYA